MTTFNLNEINLQIIEALGITDLENIYAVTIRLAAHRAPTVTVDRRIYDGEELCRVLDDYSLTPTNEEN